VFFQDRVYGPVVTDFKTSSGYIKKGSVKELKYFLQIAAYSSSINEMYKHKNLSIKRGSALCVNTKSEALQEIILEGAKLKEYENEFKKIVREWHTKHTQKYLINQ
jgi:hypothetical protein